MPAFSLQKPSAVVDPFGICGILDKRSEFFKVCLWVCPLPVGSGMLFTGLEA
jgi:hypothetical protein